MRYTGEFAVYEDIIQEMSLVYQHDKRPWMIGFRGGKDSTLLSCDGNVAAPPCRKAE